MTSSLSRLAIACCTGAITAATATHAVAQTSEMVLPNIARFAPAGYDPAVSGPSLALQKQLAGTGPLTPDWKVTPEFAMVKRAEGGNGGGGFNVVAIPTAPGTSLYATGEVAGPLLRNGRRTTAWNTDAYGYDEKNPSLYQSHPWVLAVRRDGTAFGVLLDTTWRVEIETAAQPGPQGIVFRSEGHPRPVYIIEGASPQDVVKGLAKLTGTIEMPPRWALGYHQCRYSYFPEARVREIAREFRDRDIPADIIWLDIDYMDEYRVFTWDKTHFPDPASLNADLHAMGFRTVWMIDPGVKAEPGYFVYDQGTSADAWVKRASGETYRGEVWPGWCVFPDYTQPHVRSWWAGLYKDFMATGVDGVWNDMNEPAVFNVQSKTMPEDNLHLGGDLEGVGGGGTLVKGPHLQYHNVYGMLMAKGTRDGIIAANPDKRPFVLTRAGYLGSHRYAATWTGDNSAEWDDVEQSISMILNLGLSGQPFSGPDIGGFNGNGDAALFSRWMGLGSLLPFSRGHTGKGNIDKEPWSFGPEVEKTARQALQRRYRLLPHFYTLFHEAHTTGLPIARPVFFADPADPALRSEDDAFLLGDGLLVVARTTPMGDRVPALPRGVWRQVTLVDEGTTNADLPDLLVKAGHIIPLGPVMEYSSEKPLDPLTLVISLDASGKAAGTLYEDAGEGWGFKSGEFLLTRYEASTQGKTVTVKVASTEGNMPRPSRRVEVRVLLDNGKEATDAGADGQPITITFP